MLLKLPFPNFFEEFFSPQIVFGYSLFGKCFFNNSLGSDTCMVNAGKVKSNKTPLSMESYEAILDSRGESMSEMKVSCNTWKLI